MDVRTNKTRVLQALSIPSTLLSHVSYAYNSKAQSEPTNEKPHKKLKADFSQKKINISKNKFLLVGSKRKGKRYVSQGIKVSGSSLLRLRLHGAIYLPDSFVLMLRYCANLKAIRYESTSLNTIVKDKSHRVIVA